jgi:FkbM family methyltransferase
MNVFFDRLLDKLSSSVWNNYSDNYDKNRFGKREGSFLKNAVRQKLGSKYVSKHQLYAVFDFFKKITVCRDKLELLYSNLANEKSKMLLVDILAYRVLGEKLVRLPLNSPTYHEALEKVKAIEDKADYINPNFLHFKLSKFNLNKLGKGATLYFVAEGVLIDFFLEQYKYTDESVVIGAKKGDIVIDAGGCWGDTAIYFATQIGSDGKVYSFEFIPGNTEIFRKNVSLNPHLSGNIALIENPVWENSAKTLYYTNNGPSSRVSDENFEDAFGNVQTISIDDFVQKQGLAQVNFIKMDIEGAEPKALEGAKKTIQRFRPDLAIAIYHSLDDFVNIPKWIIDLNLGYKLYLGHYTIHTEETVLFATVR